MTIRVGKPRQPDPGCFFWDRPTRGDTASLFTNRRPRFWKTKQVVQFVDPARLLKRAGYKNAEHLFGITCLLLNKL